MADLPTTNYGFIKPENGASADDWGVKWNANLDNIDTTLAGIAGAAEDAQEAAEDALQPGNALSELTATADTARTNIGAQAYSASLTNIAAISGGSKIPVKGSGDAWDSITSTVTGQALITAASAVAARTTLELGRATNIAIFIQSADPAGAALDGELWGW